MPSLSSLRSRLRPLCLLAALLAFLAFGPPARAQMNPDQQANMLLGAARRAYNEKNYLFAADRFREFLQKFGGHREAPAARYGLALSLLEGPAKDYVAAANELNQLVGNKAFPDHPFVLYYLGLAQRGQGVRALALAAAKPGEANQHRATAQQRFDEASKSFALAVAAFTERLGKSEPPPKDGPADLEWAARARCDQAEMLLRLGKAKEARAAAAPFIEDDKLKKSRYRGLGLYYHGFASFLTRDTLTAGRSLSLLAPFADPVFGTHARYLLARVHHESNERQEAQTHYEGVLADHAKQKQAAAQALGQPDRWKNDPDEKTRLEQLAKGPPPDHVARATFFLGVLQYEDGRFAEALSRLQAFLQDFPTSPLAPEARLRQGFCQVQLKQFADAQKTLQALADKEPRLADQALLWIAKAQAGAADSANPAAREQALKTALDTFRRAAERAGQMAGADPQAKTRRGEILGDLADTQQLARQFKEAAATYNQVLNDKLLPQREEELLHSLATALQLVGDYNESDKVCQRFRDAFPRSTLLPAVLFRHAENAYFGALAAEKLSDPNQRKNETARLNEEALKRYQVVVDKYPEYAHVNLARFGVAMAYCRKGELDRAREMLEAIPVPERSGELALVPYYLADILLRQAPAKVEDAVAAGKLEEQLRAAVESLEAFAGAQPNGPQTADALLKLGYCQQRLAALLAQPMDQQKAIAAARAAYEQLLQRFPKDPAQPTAVFERAKCLAAAKDTNGAINEMRRFLTDPLKASPVAPMACLDLATLLRGQNKPAEAAQALEQCRKEHEANLLKDPARASWVPLLQYHHGVALREAGKRAEARAVLDLVAKQSPDRAEAGEAALRAGQCLKDEGEMKIAEGRKKLAQSNLKPEEQAAAARRIEDGTKDVRDAVQYLLGQAEQLRQKQPASEARARMLYEAAWGARAVAEVEIEAARGKLRHELWQMRRDEVAKKTPTGGQPPFVPQPEVPLKLVPVQPAEGQARAHYQALIAAFPDSALNADARFELAEMLSERGEHEQAIKLLRDALDREPGPELTDKVRVRLGDALLAKGDAKGALAQFNPVAGNPKSAQAAQAAYRAGEAYLQSGDPAEAAKRLAIFRDQGPYQNLPGLTDRALLRLGYALGQLKQWEQSRQAYEQVVNRFGSGPWANEARYGMAWAYQNLGQFDNAVNHYAQVAANTATELGARAQMNIGLCRLSQKRYPEASTALLVVPFTYDYPHLSALSLVEAARALAESKQDEQAIKLLERVLRDHPGTESAEVARKRLAELKKR
jgi:TolA-binding protein